MRATVGDVGPYCGARGRRRRPRRAVHGEVVVGASGKEARLSEQASARGGRLGVAWRRREGGPGASRGTVVDCGGGIFLGGALGRKQGNGDGLRCALGGKGTGGAKWGWGWVLEIGRE